MFCYSVAYPFYMKAIGCQDEFSSLLFSYDQIIVIGYIFIEQWLCFFYLFRKL